MKSLEKVKKKFPLEVKMQSAPIGREIGLSVKSERFSILTLILSPTPSNRGQGVGDRINLLSHQVNGQVYGSIIICN